MKKDLLQDCNDQRIPPRDFMQTFCVRCRNPECVNAGWANSTWEGRMATQVDRLLINPRIARPEDSRFDPLRAMHFVEVAASLALARRDDPWAGPGVHLAEPDPSRVTSEVVETAVAKLAEARGKKAPTQISVEREEPLSVSPPVETIPATSESPVVAPISKRVPEVEVVSASRANTEFPEEGVMLDGSRAPSLGVSTSTPEDDPWAPKKKLNVVPKGAKIRMEG